MAGERFLLLAIDADRDGEVTLEGQTTLRDLLERCRYAEEHGYPLDTPLGYGWTSRTLMDGVYVEKPTDFTSLSFEELRTTAQNRATDPKAADAAWAEIARRVNA